MTERSIPRRGRGGIIGAVAAIAVLGAGYAGYEISESANKQAADASINSETNVVGARVLAEARLHPDRYEIKPDRGSGFYVGERDQDPPRLPDASVGVHMGGLHGEPDANQTDSVTLFIQGEGQQNTRVDLQSGSMPFAHFYDNQEPYPQYPFNPEIIDSELAGYDNPASLFREDAREKATEKIIVRTEDLLDKALTEINKD